MSAEEICRRVRAFYPWPGCYTVGKGKVLKILAGAVVHKEGDSMPGRVIALPHGQGTPVGVETGKGVLGLLRVQLEGRRALSAEEFLPGQRDFVGSVLGS